MIFRVNRPAITKKKIPKTVASKQNNREKTVCRKKDSAGSSVCVGQMTSCIGVALLCCRALLSVGGRRRRRSGSFPLSLSVLFFSSSCIRWIQSRAHELRSVFGPRDVHVRPSSLCFSLSWNGHGQRELRHAPRNKRVRLERGRGPGFN